MFSRWIVTNITSAVGTVHCRKTRISCVKQLMIYGQYIIHVSTVCLTHFITGRYEVYCPRLSYSQLNAVRFPKAVSCLFSSSWLTVDNVLTAIFVTLNEQSAAIYDESRQFIVTSCQVHATAALIR
jgi:hypothetical protein